MLFTHLLGAGILAIITLFSLKAVLHNNHTHYLRYAVSIAIGSVLQIVTGTLLTIQHAETFSLVTYCSRLGVYLAILFSVELLLYFKLRNSLPSKLKVTQ